jgi:hypothetical protein
MKRKDSTIFIGLLLTSVICLTTWFQYNTTWFEQQQEKKDAIPVIFPKKYELYKPKNIKKEKFLSYLPHSGFHNQRIELENALLLSKYLNRTLLVPPVYLSSPAMPWLRYEKLHERLLFQTKNGLNHCIKLQKEDLPLPSECLNNFRWTNVPWSFFYNMTTISNEITPIIFRTGLDYEWIYNEFNLKEDDIYFFKDMSPYEYQIHDDITQDLPLDRFNYRINLNTLENIQHNVLHFGSMFGSYRILAETEEHMAILSDIRSNMIFDNPVLNTAAENIVRKLGGANNFVGMHIRVGDGIFKLKASILVDDIFHELVNKFTDLTMEQLLNYETEEQHNLDRTESSEYEIKLRTFHAVDETSNYTKPVTINHDGHFIVQQEPNIDSSLTCQQGDAITSKFRNTVLYIATDTPDPRNHPLLSKLFKVFPCTFILSDFMNELDDIKKLQVVEERVKLESYLIPMVDAMISAHGHTFLGTPHSTFTSYIERQLHPIYTGKQVQVMGLEDYLETQ